MKAEKGDGRMQGKSEKQAYEREAYKETQSVSVNKTGEMGEKMKRGIQAVGKGLEEYFQEKKLKNCGK